MTRNKRKLVWTRNAVATLDYIYEYIKEDSARNAEKVITEIQKTAKGLLKKGGKLKLTCKPFILKVVRFTKIKVGSGSWQRQSCLLLLPTAACFRFRKSELFWYNP